MSGVVVQVRRAMQCRAKDIHPDLIHNFCMCTHPTWWVGVQVK